MTRRKQDTNFFALWQEALAKDDDGLRRLVENVVQRVLDEEMAFFLGAESYERTETRRGYRNGYKPRTLKTRVGTLELAVPKDREGRFRTEFFESCQRSEKPLCLPKTPSALPRLTLLRPLYIVRPFCSSAIRFCGEAPFRCPIAKRWVAGLRMMYNSQDGKGS